MFIFTFLPGHTYLRLALILLFLLLGPGWLRNTANVMAVTSDPRLTLSEIERLLEACLCTCNCVSLMDLSFVNDAPALTLFFIPK